MNSLLKKALLSLTLFLFLTGCTYTKRGWNNVPEKEYVSVYGDDTLPLKLAEKEASYRCKELVYSSEGYTKVCYIEKEAIVKLDGWTRRIVYTSAGLVADAVSNTATVAFYMLLGMVTPKQ